jgi:flagellar assembly protein FliH
VAAAVPVLAAAMNMSSRVLDDSATGVRSLPWRQQGQPVPGHERQKRSGPAAEEIRQLRAKIEELEAAVVQKSREAYEKGLRAGDAAAKQSLEGEVRAAVETLATTIAEVAATRSETIRRAEGDVVRLSIEIARRVLHRELSVDSSALEALIKAAIEKLQQQEVYRVRVHPDQEKLVRVCLEEAGRGQGIEVIGDPAQSKGGAFFEISRGALDASVDTQLREIERGLIDELKARS